MITKQLNDNNITLKMPNLMRIKKLNGVVFPAEAVYLHAFDFVMRFSLLATSSSFFCWAFKSFAVSFDCSNCFVI